MTTRTEFIAEAARRGVAAGNVQFVPGPPPQRDPEGAVFVVAPDAAHDRWRVHVLDRGIRDETDFSSESDALDYVLQRYFPAPPREKAT